MGFCRRCGDLVTGERCAKCGGMAVAPSVKFEKKEGIRDRWSTTYVAPPSTRSSVSGDSTAQKRPVSPVKPSSSKTTAEQSTGAPVPTTKAPSRFPRPLSGYGASTSVTQPNTSMNRISAHIASTTAKHPSPLKKHTTGGSDYSNDITVVKSHVTGALVKVHGSILESPESLSNFACYECLIKFTPDGTIYPSPTDAGKFLCRDCFESNEGAVKGICEGCHQPILALTKEEGGKPVENAGRVWHAMCFRCKACDKDISKNPMVDILGKPCCEDCFDGCLKHGSPSPQPLRTRLKSGTSVDEAQDARSGGRPSSRSREGTPVMDELAQRLGIPSSASASPERDSAPSPSGGISPTIERLTRKLTAIAAGDESPTPKSQSRSAAFNAFLNTKSVAQHRISSSASTSSASSSMYSRDTASTTGESFTSSVTSTATSSPTNSPSSTKLFDTSNSFETETGTPPTQRIRDQAPKRRSLIPVPVRASVPAAPAPSYSYMTPKSKRLSTIPGSTETTPTVSKSNTPLGAKSTPLTQSPCVPSSLTSSPAVLEKGKDSPLHAFTTPDALLHGRCDGCTRPLLAQDMRGPIVTVPLSSLDIPEDEIQVERFHHACFRCGTCGDSFGELGGRANFVREDGKPVHVSCASPLNAATSTNPIKSTYPPAIPAPIFDRSSSVPQSPRTKREKTPTRIAQSSPRTSSPAAAGQAQGSPTSTGRFVCGGCQRTVFQMERGVVPGPQSSKWHALCLVCGGKDWNAKSLQAKRWGLDAAETGCGKKLDSQARTDRLGRAYCRDCMAKLPADIRGPPSPLRNAPIVPTDTGNAGSANMNFASSRIDDVAAGSQVGRLVTHFTGASSTTFSGHGEPSSKPSPSRSTSPVRRQITGGSGWAASRSASPLKRQHTGGAFLATAASLAPQMTGSGLPITRSVRSQSVHGAVRANGMSPVKPQWTGSSASESISGNPLSPQTTGGGLIVNRPRPKSVLGSRGLGSSHRGFGLVRQMTGASDW